MYADEPLLSWNWPGFFTYWAQLRGLLCLLHDNYHCGKGSRRMKLCHCLFGLRSAHVITVKLCTSE